MMRHPQCEHDVSECRITTLPRETSNIEWQPVYDGNGLPVGEQNPNYSLIDCSCACCDMRWTVRHDHGTGKYSMV